jgi:hypothetical protein
MASGMSLPRAACLAPFAAALVVAGCAKDQELYPSLARRDQERVTGVATPVAPPPEPVAPQGPQSAGNLAKHRADAADAHRRLLAAAEAARGTVAAARGAEIGSDAWSAAAIAVGNLEAIRSETMIAAAEIDLLYTAAQTEGRETGELVSAISQVNTMVLEEDRLIAAMNQSIGR